MPVILETISWILKYVNVGVDELNLRYGVRFVYSVVYVLKQCAILIALDYKNGVKNIQTVGYNGARTGCAREVVIIQ